MPQPTLFFYSPPSYNPNEQHAYPVLLLARRAIEESFGEARKFKDGEPTEIALEALAWILDDLDWTRIRRADGSVPIPPREIQPEYILTFSWCCRLLETTPEVVREVGLSSTRLYSENPTIGGVPAIFAHWAEQRSAWLRKQSEENLALEVPPATFAPEPLSASAFD